VGELSIDVTRPKYGSSIALGITALEFAMLHSWPASRQVLSREQLLEQVWGYDYHDDLRWSIGDQTAARKLARRAGCGVDRDGAQCGV